MLEIVKKEEEEKKKLLENVKKFLKKAEKLGKFTAILYGSVARGDFNVWSDIDLIIISDSLPKDLLKRQEMLYLFCIPKIEPKGYRKDEFMKMIKLKHPFIKVLAREGIFLRDDLGIKKYLR